MNEQSASDPPVAPDPPPPAWRWETFASWGLLVVLYLLHSARRDDPLYAWMSHDAAWSLYVSQSVFGLGLGFSGARQGGRGSRIASLVALGLHLPILLWYLLITRPICL